MTTIKVEHKEIFNIDSFEDILESLSDEVPIKMIKMARRKRAMKILIQVTSYLQLEVEAEILIPAV